MQACHNRYEGSNSGLHRRSSFEECTLILRQRSQEATSTSIKAKSKFTLGLMTFQCSAQVLRLSPIRVTVI